MIRISEWLKDKRHGPRERALGIADAMGVSDLEATSRYRPYAAQQRPSFIAMVIAEWHRLVADLSRAFARRRIHRAAAASRKVKARVTPLRAPKERLPD
jgi:hypothetical protein